MKNYHKTTVRNLCKFQTCVAGPNASKKSKEAPASIIVFNFPVANPSNKKSKKRKGSIKNNMGVKDNKKFWKRK